MKFDFEIKRGQFGPMGISKLGNDISVVSDLHGKKESGIVIYPDLNKYKTAQKEIRIPFSEDFRVGSVYCLLLKDFPYESFRYVFYKDDVFISDEYGRLVDSSKKFGDPAYGKNELKCIFKENTFDWENDRPLEIPFHESILYKLHMRGFTKHSSSEVQKKGTYAGLMEKIPYLKELGITSVLSMPIFEFQDVIYNSAYSKIDDTLLPFLDESKDIWKTKTNFWGYTGGNYFAPKRSFAYSDDPAFELKALVKELHKNGIEFLVEFYFPADIRPGYILDVCRFWVKEYHVDGFMLMGCNIPVTLLISDPYLQRTKLIFESYPADKIISNGQFKNVGIVSCGYPYDVRKFLKGDEDMLTSVTNHFRENSTEYAVMNGITSYQGFTLMDLVSFDRKHNEENGESNKDGNDYNYSWNCGFEGKCRKKSVLNLREQQMRNALMMLMFSQGTPILLAGDEFCNSANGNNNPYCQDNSTSWLEWKKTIMGENMKAFTKALISYRKDHPVLHKEEPMRMTDYIAAGYPDISYHCEQAWYAGFENYNRHVGIMYCGKYAKIDRKKTDDFIYIAYNTHWINHEFALPKLPAGFAWEVSLSSQVNNKTGYLSGDDVNPSHICNVPPRTIVVLKSKELPEKEKEVKE